MLFNCSLFIVFRLLLRIINIVFGSAVDNLGQAAVDNRLAYHLLVKFLVRCQRLVRRLAPRRQNLLLRHKIKVSVGKIHIRAQKRLVDVFKLLFVLDDVFLAGFGVYAVLEHIALAYYHWYSIIVGIDALYHKYIAEIAHIKA